MTITSTDDRLEVVHRVRRRQSPAGPRPRRASPWDRVLTQLRTRPPSRPTFTITDAATACSVSRKTITRKLPELAGHGAAKDDDGVWRIPVEALLAVGLHPGRSLPGGRPCGCPAGCPAASTGASRGAGHRHHPARPLG